MPEASWSPTDESPESIESNWLFHLVRQRFHSNRSGREHPFYRIELADAVHVIAVTADDKVVLVRQFRAGSAADSVETPGGLVEPGEDPLTAGARELLEETGYAGDPPILINQCWANPSLLTSRITTIFIRNAKIAAEVSPDPGEELEILLVPRSAIPRWVRDGRISHSLCVQGLLAWMIAELPTGPWPLARGPETQFALKSLLLAVLYFGLLLASLRLDRWTFGPLLGGTIAFGAWWLVAHLDPFQGALLMRGSRLGLRHLVLRFLASLSLIVISVVLALIVWRLVHAR